jgi:hypothetical protein
MAVLEYASMPTNLSELQVREVAARQKEIIYCILANIVLTVLSLGLPPLLKALMGIVYLGLFVFTAICFFRLARKFYHPVMAVMMTIVLIVPLLGLLVLLSVNGKATNLLKRNGIAVGLMGAKLS